MRRFAANLEVDYPYLFELIDALGYGGWIGCEYRPRAGTSAGLGWFARHRATQ
jgi:hydroxypyruvate isomerase